MKRLVGVSRRTGWDMAYVPRVFWMTLFRCFLGSFRDILSIATVWRAHNDGDEVSVPRKSRSPVLQSFWKSVFEDRVHDLFPGFTGLRRIHWLPVALANNPLRGIMHVVSKETSMVRRLW